MRRSVLALISLVAACADAPVESGTSHDALPNVENPDELGRYVIGSWIIDSIELALLDEEGQVLTEPTTLYAGEYGSMVFTDGEDHEELFAEAFNRTHVYLRKLGSRMAPTKSYTFSSCRLTRKKLRVHVWEELHKCIRVSTGERET